MNRLYGWCISVSPTLAQAHFNSWRKYFCTAARKATKIFCYVLIPLLSSVKHTYSYPILCHSGGISFESQLRHRVSWYTACFHSGNYRDNILNCTRQIPSTSCPIHYSQSSPTRRCIVWVWQRHYRNFK
jgi:hypothetical protein